MGTALFAVFGALIVVFQVRLPLLVNILPSVLNSLTVPSTLSHKKSMSVNPVTYLIELDNTGYLTSSLFFLFFAE